MDTSGRRARERRACGPFAYERKGCGARQESESESSRAGVTQRLGHLEHRGRNCFELQSRNAVETRSLGNVVIRERFKLVYNTSETASETVRSGHGVERDGARRPAVQAARGPQVRGLR